MRLFTSTSAFLLLLLYCNLGKGYCNTNAILAAYDWDENRPLFPISENDHLFDATARQVSNVLEYVFEDNKLTCYELVHKVVFIRNDRALKDFGHMFIPLNGGKLVKFKARCILPNGIEIQASPALLSSYTDPQVNDLRIPLEGLQKGCELEYYYIIEKVPSFSGSVFIQSEIPQERYRCEFILPEGFQLISKGYNGVGSFQLTKFGARSAYFMEESYITPVIREDAFFSHAHNKRIQFIIKNNTSLESQIHWDDLALTMSRFTYPEIDPKEVKFVKKVIQSIFNGKELTEDEKIRKLDSYLRNSIRMEEMDESVGFSPKKIIENKYASPLQFLRLYATCLENAEIEHRLVLTTKKEDKKFDPTFPCYEFLEEYLFYFPKTNAYTEPLSAAFSYGLLSPSYFENEALFVKKIPMGKSFNVLAHTARIDPSKKGRNKVESSYDVKFSDQMNVTEVVLKRHLSGFQVTSPRFFNEIKQHASIRNSLEQPEEPNSLEAERSPIEFEYQHQFNQEEWMHIASDKFLFKVGELLDAHPKPIYIRSDRQVSIERLFPESYSTVIEIEIPQGYFVRNLEDLNHKISFGITADERYAFISSYTLFGNRIRIEVEEVYPKSTYEVTEQDKLKQIIDASAAFSQIFLIFERK